jgi:hypothetical protein
VPIINVPGAPPELVALANNCLLKAALTRLEVVSWDDFNRPLRPASSVQAAKDRIAQRIRIASSVSTAAGPPGRLRAALATTSSRLEELSRDLLEHDKDSFPPREVRRHDSTDHVCLRIRFSKSEHHALSMPLSAFLDLEPLSDIGEAWRIRASARLGLEGEECVRNLASRQDVILFEGVWQETLVENRIADFIYLCIDSAQAAMQAGASATEWFTVTMVENGAI